MWIKLQKLAYWYFLRRLWWKSGWKLVYDGWHKLIKNAQNVNHFFITNHQRLLKASPHPSHDSLQRTSPADRKLTLHHWHHVLQSAVALQYKVQINRLCRDKILRWFENQIIREQSLRGVETVPGSVYGCFLFLTLERRKNGVINVSIYKIKKK